MVATLDLPYVLHYRPGPFITAEFPTSNYIAIRNSQFPIPRSVCPAATVLTLAGALSFFLYLFDSWEKSKKVEGIERSRRWEKEKFWTSTIHRTSIRRSYLGLGGPRTNRLRSVWCCRWAFDAIPVVITYTREQSSILARKMSLARFVLLFLTFSCFNFVTLLGKF